MRLSWNEIRSRAATFARDWQGDGYEKGQTQLFYQHFFEVFGVPVRRVATFEEPVKNLGNRRGFIDLFWKGMLLVEQKSAGRDLKKAKSQALDYFPGLKDEDLPRYILLSDFQTFELYDLDDGYELKFPLVDLHKHVHKLGFITGVQKKVFKDQDPVNVKASELVGALHDALEESGYVGHDLERFLVRIVFCLFADDTGIFEIRGAFEEFIEGRTREDGSDLGGLLTALFQALNTPDDKRPKTLDEDLLQFPYVNGDLFHETLTLPSFNTEMRDCLLQACRFDWSEISPAIFGSLFQSVMDRDERRKQGAHYTNETNILKVISPLFLDGLQDEFKHLKAYRGNRRRTELEKFRKRLGQMKFFDPACGCGNFLIIAYRELRLLEIEVVRELIDYQRNSHGQFVGELNIPDLSQINVDQFYGIEIGPFPARIAETAMWMMDHMMNNRLSLEFGWSYVRIPLRKSPHIVVDNALEIDWADVLPPAQCSFVFGNPPFVGHQYRTDKQKADMWRLWGRQGQVNRLDYVTCWFKEAVEYSAENKTIKTALVSTNSITQGEQCGIFWPHIFSQGISIHFAHRTFQWNSEARGMAAVHCVIIGMTWEKPKDRTIFEYDHVCDDPHTWKVSRINGYLIDGAQYSVPARSLPPTGRLRMHKGSQPTDGARLRKPGGGFITHSNLILDEENRSELLARDPNAAKWLRRYVGGDELISGQWRWCLWLKDAHPAEYRRSAAVQERLDRVREGRKQSSTESVRRYAKYPTLFTQDRQPSEPYLAIPMVSSETREYIPMAVLQPDVVASNQLQIIVGAPILYFGILTSAMHMGWMRTVAGRLESRYRYSPAVYNSFPWPVLTPSKEKQITDLAQAVLDVRVRLSRLSNLGDLYDPNSMPPILHQAHQCLDQAVDRLYRRSGFRFERERVEHLFELFERESAPLDSTMRKRSRRKS